MQGSSALRMLIFALTQTNACLHLGATSLFIPIQLDKRAEVFVRTLHLVLLLH